MTDAPEPGIYPDIPMDEYRAWPYPNYSLLKLWRKDLCDEERKAEIEKPTEPNDAMRLGSMVEVAIHDEAAVGADTQPYPAGVKQKNSKAYNELVEANPGITYLPPSLYAKHGEMVAAAKAMAKKIKADEWVWPKLDGALRQVSFVCDLTFDGMLGERVTHRVKGRADYLRKKAGLILDLKTTSYGGPRSMGRVFHDQAYDVQAALYANCLTKLLGKPLQFYFIMVRTVYPYVVTPYNTSTTEMAGELLRYGQNAYETYLERHAECVRTGVWGGYRNDDDPLGKDRILSVIWPPWAA